MGLLYGRAGRLNTKNDGFRPGQELPACSGGGVLGGDGGKGIAVMAGLAGVIALSLGAVLYLPQVRKTPCWPRNWASFSLISLYSHRNAWANWHLLGQPNTFLAAVLRGVRRRGVHRPRAGPLALQAEHAAAGQPAGLPEVGLVSVSAIKC